MDISIIEFVAPRYRLSGWLTPIEDTARQAKVNALRELQRDTWEVSLWKNIPGF